MPEQNELLKTSPEVTVENKTIQSREIIADQRPEVMIPRDVKSFLQKIEEAPTATPTFDPNGQPQLTASPPTNPKIIIPITRTTFIDGFKKSFDDVGLWLSHFFFREIKLKDGNVSFKQNDS